MSVIIGIGNRYRRDDAIGLIIARRVIDRLNFELIECSEPSSMIGVIDRYKEVIIIDAMSLKSRVGRVHRFDNSMLTIDAHLTSTHALNILEVLRLLESLGSIPDVTLYAIEVLDLGIGEGLSRELEIKIEDITDEIVNDIVHRVGYELHK